MSHMPSEAMAHIWVTFALSAATSTMAAIWRSVTLISSVSGKMRFTDTSATQASRSTLLATEEVSTFRSVVPWGTAARMAISSLVRWSAPFTFTDVMAKAPPK